MSEELQARQIVSRELQARQIVSKELQARQLQARNCKQGGCFPEHPGGIPFFSSLLFTLQDYLFLIWKQRKAVLQVPADAIQVGAAVTHSKSPTVEHPGCT